MKCEMRWRWDQGRLLYFQYECIVAMAKVLSRLDGIDLKTKDDLLRKPLMETTCMPFAPATYKVWRNYARVFQCAMLATCINNRLVVTDLCRELTKSPSSFSPDEYFNFVFSHFSFPFPAFEEYSPTFPKVFPFVAIIKFAISRQVRGVSLNDVFSFVVGNNCSGLEDGDYYANLKATERVPLDGDERRQVREMLSFLGQVSYLKWLDNKLYLDTTDYKAILDSIRPSSVHTGHKLPQEEFLAQTTIGHEMRIRRLDTILRDRPVPFDTFHEGGRVFNTHGKIERSPLVRKYYFRLHPQTICDACHINVKERYPWTNNILELHHILPLSATLNVGGTTTSLDDMVPLCPSCHKSIHIYYRLKLAEWGVSDFGSKKMAEDVYQLAKNEVKI